MIVIVRRRRLPHIDVPGQPVFVTFRLYGSLPNCRSFPDLTSGEAFAAMDRLLDQTRRGPTFLSHPAVAATLLDWLENGGEHELHSWVIMPNHVHLLITAHVSLSRLMQAWKGATARRANFLLHRTGQPFWQEESYDHVVRSGEEFRRIQNYIENNPVRAGLVSRPQDYRWSSAWQLVGQA